MHITLLGIKDKKIRASYANNEIEEVFKFIMCELNVSLVHFHHFLGLPLSLLKIPETLGIKSLASVHDFFFVDSAVFLKKRWEFLWMFRKI